MWTKRRGTGGCYQPADLDIVNDCNRYQILVKFPDNYWLKVGKKPYFLSEIHFREPGENAVNGKRPRMSIQLVHFSPEGVFLIIEVPIVAGKDLAFATGSLDGLLGLPRKCRARLLGSPGYAIAVTAHNLLVTV